MARQDRLVPTVLAAALLLALSGCGEPDDGTTGDRGELTAPCAAYVEVRDAGPDEAAAGADALARAGADHPGLDDYVAYLRDAGDGTDEGLYDDQYRLLLDGDALDFVAAADDECGAGSSSDAPANASRDDYCAAFEGIFEGRVADLATVGTPADLGAGDEVAPVVRRGFEALVARVPDPDPEQVEVMEAGDDDEFRQLLGVTDAFYADTWAAVSFELCIGED